MFEKLPPEIIKLIIFKSYSANSVLRLCKNCSKLSQEIKTNGFPYKLFITNVHQEDVIVSNKKGLYFLNDTPLEVLRIEINEKNQHITYIFPDKKVQIFYTDKPNIVVISSGENKRITMVNSLDIFTIPDVVLYCVHILNAYLKYAPNIHFNRPFLFSK